LFCLIDFRLLYKMKSFSLILLAVFVACATAFAPVAQTTSRPAFKPMAVSKLPESESVRDHKQAAAIAAFATAIAPIAAANAVDEGTIIGYGAGLVACVVSLAVGFAIGYGTLVKP
jgi:hypothetical protein